MKVELEKEGRKITVYNNVVDADEAELLRYIDYVEDNRKQRVNELTVSMNEKGEITLDYVLQAQKFERIRRITGYLVGTIDRWNDGKRAEEHERLKHA